MFNPVKFLKQFFEVYEKNNGVVILENNEACARITHYFGIYQIYYRGELLKLNAHLGEVELFARWFFKNRDTETYSDYSLEFLDDYSYVGLK